MSARFTATVVLILGCLAVPHASAAAMLLSVTRAGPEDGDVEPLSHCDVTGTVLVPQPVKTTTITHLGIGSLNGVFNYRIGCVHPDAPFTLRYNDRILSASCAGTSTSTVDGRVAVADFDIVFWPAGEVVRPVREFRACGDDAGTVPFAAAFADVVLMGGLPGAEFTYSEG